MLCLVIVILMCAVCYRNEIRQLVKNALTFILFAEALLEGFLIRRQSYYILYIICTAPFCLLQIQTRRRSLDRKSKEAGLRKRHRQGRSRGQDFCHHSLCTQIWSMFHHYSPCSATTVDTLLSLFKIWQLRSTIGQCSMLLN